MLRVNEKRLEETILALGSIGFEKDAGTSRISFSPRFMEGREYVRKLMEEAGMKTRIDPVGNLIGRLEGKEKEKKIIAAGSHIDTVPCGGMYDGAYGVLAAIECVKTLQEAGYENRHPIEVFGFIDEEGAAIGGTFGSKCAAAVPLSSALKEKMKEYGVTEEQVKRAALDQKAYRAYYELHIEQGGVLEKENIPVGITDGIVGILRYEFTVRGKANHAGTTPMDLRDDPMLKTCRIIEEITEEVCAFEGMVCTVGRIHAHPGTYNVIPDTVDFSLDIRYKEMEPMYAIIEKIQEKYGASVEIIKYIDQPPTYCDTYLQEITENSVKQLNLKGKRMYSGAGHDLINMAFLTASALIFIPSIGGISHHMDEYSRPEDMAAGADVLLNNILYLDREE